MNSFKNPYGLWVPITWWLFIKDELRKRQHTQVIVGVDYFLKNPQTIESQGTDPNTQEFKTLIVCSLKDSQDIPTMVHELCHVWQLLREAHKTRTKTELEEEADKWEDYYRKLPFESVLLVRPLPLIEIESKYDSIRKKP